MCLTFGRPAANSMCDLGPLPFRTSLRGCPTGGLIWERAGISKRRGGLRRTRDGERRDDFDIRRQRWTGDALPAPGSAIANCPGYARPQVAVLSNEKLTETSGTRLPQLTVDPARASRNLLPLRRALDGNKWAWQLDIAAPLRHDRSMDRHALERLGHDIVSRRLALGYHNRTDLADSLQLTPVKDGLKLLGGSQAGLHN
jgi:hypothetical protein